MNNVKALIVQVDANKDLGDVLQIGRAEAMHLFKNPTKIKILDVLPSRFGYVLVVQNSDGCIAESKKT